jgi:hypothetical protein
LRDARYRASQEAKAKRKEAYDPVKRKEAYDPVKRKEAYDPVKRKEAYDPVKTKEAYDPVKRKEAYDREARQARHQTSYNPAARKASYVSRLPQWSLTNVDKIPQHTRVKQEWGFGENEKCPHCNCIFLRSSSESFRRKCCNNGAFNVSIPHLKPLLDTLKDIVDDEDDKSLRKFTSASSSYNNILSLGEY